MLERVRNLHLFRRKIGSNSFGGQRTKEDISQNEMQSLSCIRVKDTKGSGRWEEKSLKNPKF